MTDIRGTSPDLRDLLTRATAAGWLFRRRSSAHILAIYPKTGETVTLASTASDWRSIANAYSDLERISGPLRPRPGNGRTAAEKAEARRRELARQANTTRRRMAYQPQQRRAATPPPTAMETALMDFLDRTEDDTPTQEADTHDRDRSAS